MKKEKKEMSEYINLFSDQIVENYKEKNSKGNLMLGSIRLELLEQLYTLALEEKKNKKLLKFIKYHYEFISKNQEERKNKLFQKNNI